MSLLSLLSLHSPALSIPSLLVLGAAASPHCTLMCGALAIHQARSVPGIAARESLLWTQAGRISGYAALGGIAGGAGQSVLRALPSPWLGELLMAAAAIAAVLLGLSMIWRLPRRSASLHCHPRTAPAESRWPVRPRLLLQGAAWALIPCGLLYSVLLLAALSSSASSGALLAGAFAVGGSPALALIGWSGTRLAGLPASARLAGVWLVALGSVSLAAVLLAGPGHLAGWCAASRV